VATPVVLERLVALAPFVSLTLFVSLMLFVSLTIGVSLVGCQPAWEAAVVMPGGELYAVDASVLEALAESAETVEDQEAVPLEQILWEAGHRVIERLIVIGPEGERTAFEWPESTDGGAWWQENGRLYLDKQTMPVSRIEVQAAPLLDAVQASIINLAPTAAAALGLPAPSQATGRALDVPSADRVMLVFVDGFGYLRYQQALAKGDLPYLESLEEPLVALTTYPPVTNVSTASLLTGAPPAVHGAWRRGIRKTKAETLFDVAAADGRRVVAIEGEALAFQLRGAEWQLSGDRDGDGSTDDNVRANAMRALAAGDVPDLFYVHLHGIDDAGHTYGPGAAEERAAVRRVDAIVKELVQAMPPGTLVLIFADHGMHPVNETGRLGNHGHLIAEDMLIPVFALSK
jgi:hypothetical protein